MVYKPPTNKQKEKFSAVLENRIIKLDLEISTVERQIQILESSITEKISRKEKLLNDVSVELNHYSMIFELGWPNFEQAGTDVDKARIEIEIQRLVTEESKLREDFQNKKSELKNIVQQSLGELRQRNPGKLRHFERRLIQKQIDEQLLKLDQIDKRQYPREDELLKILKLFKSLKSLKFEANLGKVSTLQRKKSKLILERKKIDSQRSGAEFDDACVQFVQDEREKRKLAAADRERVAKKEEISKKRQAEARKRRKALNERQQRAKASVLKVRVSRNEKFLSDNSEKINEDLLRLKKREVERLERQYSRVKEDCIRKVKQLRLRQGPEHLLVPQQLSDDAVIRELLNQKRTWHRFPSLDDSVANLKLKKSELTEAKKVIERIEKLLQKILEAKLEIAEFNKISHLLVSGKANVRGAPPRIAVENWKDAETLALLYVKWLGFQDAKKSKAGSDEGKDVESSKCVAQVKDMGTGATREMVQRLFGVASAEKKTPIFFSRTYAKTAVDWANTHNIALFSFNIRGVVTPVTEKAKQLTLR